MVKCIPHRRKQFPYICQCARLFFTLVRHRKQTHASQQLRSPKDTVEISPGPHLIERQHWRVWQAASCCRRAADLSAGRSRSPAGHVPAAWRAQSCWPSALHVAVTTAPPSSVAVCLNRFNDACSEPVHQHNQRRYQRRRDAPAATRQMASRSRCRPRA
jgi:hypothetical protein